MTASATIPSDRVAGPNWRPSRLRPAVYAVLVALVPTAVAGWAVGRNAARSASHNASAAVVAEALGAGRVSARSLASVEGQAVSIARSLPVQRAFAHHDLQALARLARRHANTTFVVRGKTLGGLRDAVASRTAVVTLGGKGIGTVVVGLPRQALLDRLQTGVRLAGGDRLLLAPPGTAKTSPADLRLDGRFYRAAAVPISNRVEAVVARPRSVVDDAVRNAWLIALGAALATLATVGVIAWASAPLIVRGRIAQRERAEALQVLAHLRDGVFFADLKGIVRFWNRAAERITGLSRQQVWGRPLSSLPGLARIKEQIPVGEEGSVQPQTFPVQLGTRELWLSLAGVEVAQGTVYTFADVTEEQRLEQLKNNFLATVSHELRTPLAGLYGAAVTLRERGDSLERSDRTELLGTLGEQAERLVRIVEDVLVASELESKRLHLSRERFDAVALTEAVVEAARLRYGTVRVQLGEAESVYAVADEARTRQVLENLIDNAVKYAARGPVRVAVERTNGLVVFSVADDGPGIPEDKRERIFEKFYRSDVQMAGGVPGTGLGLYICRELVTRMGGRLWLDSTLGAGSLFLFELPSLSG